MSPMQAGPAPMSALPALHSSFGSSQMQTPPPTRGTTARKVQPTQIAFGTPSTIASKKFATRQQQSVLASNAVQQSPSHFQPVHFTPNVYQFSNAGPTSAPAPAQTQPQFFWDQSGNVSAYLLPQQQPPSQRPLEDPFVPALQPGMSWSNGPSPNLQNVAFDTPAMVSFPTQEAHPRPVPTTGLGGPSTAVPASQLPSSTGVDPSLLYSSPARPVLRSNSYTSNRPRPDHPLTSRKDSGNSNQGRSDSAAPSPAAKPLNVPTIRRSNTVGHARPKSAHFDSAIAEMSRSHSIAPVPRAVSPPKRAAKTTLGSISELKSAKRASVILTIDKNGRARTETVPREDSPTRSMRQRYPGLFDSDSSDNESEISDTPSRAASASFSFAKNEERRAKAARLDPPVENLEGLNILRSASSTSMKGVSPSRAAIAAAAQLRRSGSSRRSASGRNSTARRLTAGGSQTSLIDSCPMDMSSHQHQSASGAGSVSPESEQTQWANGDLDRLALPAELTLDAHNRRWSMMSFEQQSLHSVSPQHQSNGQSYHNAIPSSSASYAARPQSRHPGLLVRCLCGVSDDQGQMMVQCASCTQWLHAPCIGVRGPQAPADYTCFLCTKPNMGDRRR